MPYLWSYIVFVLALAALAIACFGIGLLMGIRTEVRRLQKRESVESVVRRLQKRESVNSPTDRNP